MLNFSLLTPEAHQTSVRVHSTQCRGRSSAAPRTPDPAATFLTGRCDKGDLPGALQENTQALCEQGTLWLEGEREAGRGPRTDMA